MTRDNSIKCFDEKTYEEDILEFTGKPLSFWKEKRIEFLERYGPEYPDHICSDDIDFSKPTYEFLVDRYNTIGWLTSVYTHEWFIKSNRRELLEYPLFRFFKNFIGDEHKIIIDHGCKMADISWVFWTQGYHVIAVDLPLDYIKFLNFRIKKYNISDIEFVTVDRELSFLKDRKVDAIFSQEVFEHCINAHKVLAYLSDHLKIGGLFYISISFTSGGFHLTRNGELFASEENEKGNIYGNKRWKDCILAAGLEENESYKKEKIPDSAGILYEKKREVDFECFNFE